MVGTKVAVPYGMEHKKPQDNRIETLTQNDGVASVFALPSSLTIESAEALASSILKQGVPDHGKTFTLDASQNEIITTPGVQVILALSKTIAASGGKLSILKPSDTFIRNFEILGFTAELNEWRGNHD